MVQLMPMYLGILSIVNICLDLNIHSFTVKDPKKPNEYEYILL